MLHSRVLQILIRIRDLTASGLLQWAAQPDGWFTAMVGEKPIHIRFLNYEATNQIGSDPRMFENTMPGFNHIFAFGSEGACLLFETLGYANVGYPMSLYEYDAAERLLDTLATETPESE